MEQIYFLLQIYYIFSNISNIYLVIYLLLPLFFMYKIELRIMSNSDNIHILRKNDIVKSWLYSDNSLPIGLFYGYHNHSFFIGYIKMGDNECNNVFILSSKSVFEFLIQNKTFIHFEDETKKIEYEFTNLYVNTSTSYNWTSYKKRTFDTTHFSADKYQDVIIYEILDFYNKNGYCVSFIDGDIGLGKTFIGILLAKQTNGSLCKSFNPCSPGDKLENIYTECQPSKTNPLIILLDEVEIMLDNIHNKNVVLHKTIPTQVYNKCTWNSFLDDFQWKLYPYVIILLISNKPLLTLRDTYDASYLRPKRINCFFTLYDRKNDIID